MREILFRGKHIHALPQNKHLDGIWVYGYLSDKNYINTQDEDEYGGKFTSEVLVDPETICQYTGLTDRTKWEQLSESEKNQFLSEWNYEKERKNVKEDWNGRKIFEGDIVKHFNDSTIPLKFEMGIISWNKKDCKFHRSSSRDNNFYLIRNYCEYEIIGNIFDNPELREELDHRRSEYNNGNYETKNEQLCESWK